MAGGDFERTYDQAFKRILRSPVIFAGITYFLHPDFHRFSPGRIAACAQRDACNLLVLQDSEIWQAVTSCMQTGSPPFSCR